MNYNPEDTGRASSGIFGLPYTQEESQIIIMPVPWDVTTSYGKGTSLGPEAVLQASPQLDLFDSEFQNAYEKGIHLLPTSKTLLEKNKALNVLSQQIVADLESTGELSQASQESQKKINEAAQELEEETYKLAQIYLKKGKTFAILGGDHSVPLGAIRAYLDQYPGQLSILHIDAHADLRRAYQGFEQSHASIMYNVLKHQPLSLTQVGVRDYCQSEYEIMSHSDFISVFLDKTLKEYEFQNISWQKTCEEILSTIKSPYVYISFDIDGLSPEFCPHTGTPVPGGLSYSQAVYLIRAVAKAGKVIVGFDLCEVSPDPKQLSEWDGNVGARILYQLCGWSLKSQENRK